jgi:hypothetical protein
LVLAGGAGVALAQTDTTTTSAMRGADLISCGEIAGLDDQQAEQVLFYVAGYLEGQGSADMDLGAAPATPDATTDDSAAIDSDADATAGVTEDTQDDLAAAPEADTTEPPASEDLSATDPATDDDIAAAPETDTMDDPATDDDLAAAPEADALDDPAADDDLAAAPETDTMDDPASDDDLAAAPETDTMDDPATDDDLAAAPETDTMDDPASGDDLAATDPAVDTETTAAVGEGADQVVGLDVDIQQVVSACQDDPSQTISAAIEQHRSAQ